MAFHETQPQKQFLCMSSSTICPFKIASAVDFEGVNTKIQCLGEDCAWFLEGYCSIRIIAAEFHSKEKRGHQGPSAD